MTTLIGVVEGDRAYMAADSMVGLGNQSLFNAVKIRPHPDAPESMFLGAAGTPLLLHPAALTEPVWVAGHEQEVAGPPDFDWGQRFWATIRDLPSPPVDADNSNFTDGNLMVMTPGAVATIGSTGVPFFADWHGLSLGSGGDFALGAYHAYRDSCPEMPVEEALTRAVLRAIFLDLNSGGVVRVVSL